MTQHSWTIPEGSGTTRYLREYMNRYRTPRLKSVDPAAFRAKIEEFIQLVDHRMEGYESPEKQRDLSVRFHWGHNHDFGTFALEGRMGDRHLWLISEFINRFKAIPLDLAGKNVIDIGCWTGGTSLLLSAMGASVYAIDEVRKYVDCLNYIAGAFGVSSLRAERRSLYECTTPELQDRFDYALFAGVLYHVTDPILALRHVFNMLRDGGTCLLETYAHGSGEALVKYEGPGALYGGSREALNRGGWNWFVPSAKALAQMMRDVGFEDVQVSPIIEPNRLLAVGRRTRHVDMLRAGLSVPNVR